MATLEEIVVETEKMLYNERKGELYRAIMDRVERPLIEHALLRTGGNQLGAARLLGINRNTIRAKMRKLGIDASRRRT